MQRPPRNPSEGIFEPGARAQIILFGLFIALVTLGAFWLGWRESTVKGQTLAFATLAFSQLVHVFNFRSCGVNLQAGYSRQQTASGGRRFRQHCK